jgi:hypothetical protein
MLHLPSLESPMVEPKTGALRFPWWPTFKALGASYGTWTAVPFDAALYTGNGSMTVTVGTQTTYAYVLMGKFLIVSVVLASVTVAGTPSTAIRIALPGSLVAARAMSAPIALTDNGTAAIGVARVSAGGTVIEVKRVDGSAWTASAGTSGIEGSILLEVR